MENNNVKQPVLDEDQKAVMNRVRNEKTAVMDPIAYKHIQIIARDLAESRALPASFQNPYQVQMAIMAGREMGMSTMESLSDLYFVNGKLQIYGKATPAALRRAGWRITFKDEPDSCTATITNTKTGEEITDTFTLQDAELSGFVKDKSGRVKAAWQEGANRKRKLRYAVLSQIIHTYVPEVLGAVAGIGEYSEDYMEASSMDKEFRKQQSEERVEKSIAALMEDEDENN